MVDSGNGVYSGAFMLQAASLKALAAKTRFCSECFNAAAAAARQVSGFLCAAALSVSLFNAGLL